eukprot:5378590-Alexandrium_andersonii.AAC.1
MVGDHVIGVGGVCDRAGIRDALCEHAGGVLGIEVQRPCRVEVDERAELPALLSAVGSVPGASGAEVGSGSMGAAEAAGGLSVDRPARPCQGSVVPLRDTRP